MEDTDRPCAGKLTAFFRVDDEKGRRSIGLKITKKFLTILVHSRDIDPEERDMLHRTPHVGIRENLLVDDPAVIAPFCSDIHKRGLIPG